jgi:hypothetical protein
MTPANILIILLLAFLAFSGWWLFFRKKRLKWDEFPSAWRDTLLDKVGFYKQLKKRDQKQFEDDVLHFLSEVEVTGVDVEVDDTDRVLVAASAVIPLFGFPGWRYRNLNEVLLYEGTFNAEYDVKAKDKNILGMVGSGSMQRMMILSKPALHQSFANKTSKTHLGIHEFVHLLDKADGSVDGIPEELLDKQYCIPWLNKIQEEIADIKANDSDINPYGATNKAEFFSVASEYFFKRPKLLARKHPDLYELLERIFRQDPAEH